MYMKRQAREEPIMWKRVTIGMALLGAMSLAIPALAGGRPLTADLAAGNEVGQPGDPGTTGSAFITLNQGQGEICFDIDVEGESAPILAAHIHDAPAGVNSGVVVNFEWGQTGGSGCVEVDAELIKDIRQNPDQFYVNVHNSIASAGAARGQLSK